MYFLLLIIQPIALEDNLGGYEILWLDPDIWLES